MIPVWLLTGVSVGSLIALGGLIYGYRTELVRQADDIAELRRKQTLAEGRLNQLARRVLDNEQRNDTGPINTLDRPTLAQLAAPTRPDLEAQKPALHTGATAVGGRHRAAA